MRTRMRYGVPFALAAIAAVALVGIALAAADGNSSSLSGSKFSPSTLPKTTYKAGSLFVHTHTNYAHPGSTLQGGITDHAQLYFDDDGKLNPTGVPTCAKSAIAGNIDMAAAMAQCGSAKIGSGKAAAILIQAGTPHNINACVLLFNGKKNAAGQATNLVFTRAQASVPSSISCSDPAHNHQGNTTVLLEGTIKANPTSLGGDFSGGKMVDYPHISQASPFPLTDFQVTVKRGGFISARCHDTDHKLNFKGKFTYSDGQSDTVSTSQTCTVG
jgi:hypothetical protein